MKTFFKSVLYFSFAGLVFTSCAKNDDFSVPSIDCKQNNVKANQTTDGLYTNIQDGKEILLYDKEEVISGIVISSDEAGNFYQQLIIVDETTQKPVTLKVDVKGGYAIYPVGTKVVLKMKGTYLQNSYGMITIGGGIYTATSGSKYPDVITAAKLKTSLFKDCTVLTGDKFAKYINKVTIEQLKADKSLYGKLISVDKVQFDRAIVGQKYYDAASKDNDAQGYTLRKMVDEKGNSLVVRTGKYSNGLINQVVSDRSGTITGIVSEFKGVIQFYPRTMADMNLTQDPFDSGTGPVGPEDPNIIVEPGKFLAFPGADFEDWNVFMKSLNSYGLDKTTTEAKSKGWNNSTGLAITGVPEKTGYAFTIANVKTPSDATKISFLMKGTSSARSLSINLYKGDGTAYYAYNLKDISSSKVIAKSDLSTNSQYINDYEGTIDTKDKWIRVVLDVSGTDFNKSAKGNFIAFKIGGATKNIASKYDLVIDEIRFDDGTAVGGEDPVDPAIGDKLVDFSDWNNFVKSTGSFGIKHGVEAVGQGRDGKTAMAVKTTPGGNDFLFTISDKAIPAGKTKIVVWVKGLAGKSLSFNVYKDAKAYDPFNTPKNGVTKNEVLSKSANNQYGGVINTSSKSVEEKDFLGYDIKDCSWVKLTLDLSTMTGPYNSSGTGNVFGIKVGKSVPYNILIDSIYFE